MATISSTFSDRGTGPYSRPLKVKVVSTDEPVTYRGTDGSEKKALHTAISDGEQVVKLVCYDQAKFPKLVEGNTIVLREIIRKTEEGTQSIVATKNTKIFLTGGMEVPESHSGVGFLILNPPPAPTIPIKEALRSPMKTRVSVVGRVVQDEEVRVVKVRGEDVPLKTITMEDVTGKSKVTLWRDISQTEMHPGDYITVSDVVLNVWRNESSLSSTSRSKIKKSEAPLESMQVEVVGISLDEGTAELLLEDDEVLAVPAELLQQAIGGGNVETFTSDGAKNILVQRRGSDIISLEIIR